MAFDKRKFHRFRNFKLHIEFKHSSARYYSSVELIDISSGGLCFLTNTQVGIDNNLNFKFSFGSKKILMSGIAARINGREVGVEFTNSDNEITKFVSGYNKEVERLKIEFPDYKISPIFKEHADNPMKNEEIEKILNLDL